MIDDTIVGALQLYLEQCPLLAGGRLNVDYLPKKPFAYMISPSPVDEVVTQYHGGSSIRQYVFVLATVNFYGDDVLVNMANSGFYERLAAWMRMQTRTRTLPPLGDTRTPQKLEAMSTGYLYDANTTEARYQIQCRLVYHQKGD